MRSIFLIILFVPLAIFAGLLTTQYSSTTLLLGAVGVAIFLVSFVNIEIGLYILILSMLLSPEFLAGSESQMIQGRGVTLRYEDFLLVIIGASWFAKNAVFKEIGLFRRTELNLPIVLYIVACLLSTGFGIISGLVSPKSGFFFVLKYVEYYIVFFMMANHIENIDQAKRFVYLLLITCFIVSIIGILQIPGGERVSAPFEGDRGEPNTFGGYLVFSMAIIIGLMRQPFDTKKKVTLLILLLTVIPPLLFTQSRASFLSMFVVILVFSLASKKRLIYIFLMVMFVIASPFILPGAVKNRILYTFNQPVGTEQRVQIGGIKIDSSTSARLLSWKNALADWTKRPILGYGVTGYSFLDAQFPRVLVETGIVGFIAFLFLITRIFKMAFNNLAMLRENFSKGICFGFIAGYIGLLVHSIGANTFIIVRIMEPFWFYAGIVAMLPELEAMQYGKTEGKGMLRRGDMVKA